MRKCLDSIEPGNLAKLSSYREQGPVGGDQSHNGHDRKTQAPKSDVSQMLTKGWVPIAKLKKIKKDFSDLGATWVS